MYIYIYIYIYTYTSLSLSLYRNPLKYTIQYNCNLILPSLQSSEVHIEARKLLESIDRAEEVSFQFRAKDSLYNIHMAA